MKKGVIKQKQGQVTIFIIIAIVVVALAVLVYLFYPKISSALGFGSQSPSQFLQNCLEDEVEAVVLQLSARGGSVAPEHYVVYDQESIEYLCYTGENYKTCVMQKPLLQSSIEKEIIKEIRPQLDECIQDLKKSYEKK